MEISESAAPMTAPSPQPAPAPAAAPSAMDHASGGAASPVTPTAAPESTRIDPKDYPIREDYAKALLETRLRAISGEAAPIAPEADSPEAGEESQGQLEPEAADTGEQGRQETEETVASDNELHEPDFQLEIDAAVTPEGLSQWVRDNADFSKLLESDPKLKGQLYKTAREAAELAPYREIFPDLESAKTAQSAVETFSDVRESFLGSTTRDGTLAALAKIAELSYEHAEDGSVLTEDGEPVIGDDFFAFVENVAGLNLEHRSLEIEDRLRTNLYHSQEERERDEAVKAALDTLREENAATSPATEEWPEQLRLRQEALDERENELNRRHHRADLEQRRTFERGLQEEARKRIGGSIDRILSNVEKQGALVSPYLKNILPQAIGAKLVRKVQANPTLQAQMRELQRLPAGDQSRQRRLAAIDRAIQQYLPEVAREELREAGVQIANTSAAKHAKVAAQIDTTRKTEPKGSTGPSGAGKPFSASTAFEHAQAEWQRANPGHLFDSAAKEQILPRVLQLMSSR